MAIVIHQGAVAVKEGRITCSCCEEDDIELGADVNFGETGNCDCETVVCFNADTNPSPANMTIGGLVYPNADPNTDHFVFVTQLLQGPTTIFVPGSPVAINAWRNYFSQPSIVRLTGQVGGDIALEQLLGPGSAAIAAQNGISFPANWNSVYRMTNLIPQDGQFPCGVCDTPRNGPHNVDYVFALWPYTYFRIKPWTYFDCAPHYSLRLRRLGPLAP